MQYSINVNQLVLANDPQAKDAKIDLIDAAMLEYIYHLCSSINARVESQRITADNQRWTWVDYQTLISKMPLLRIKDAAAITRRMKKLVQAGFIVIHRHQHQRTYVRLLPKVEGLLTKDNSAIDAGQQLSPNEAIDEYQPTLILDNSSTTNAVTNETDYRKRLETKALEGKQEQTPKVRGKPEAIVVTQPFQAKAQWVVDQLGTEEDEVTSVLKMCKRYSPAEIDQAVRAVIDHPHQRARTRLFFSRLWEIAGVRKAPTYEEFEEDYEEVYD